MPSTLGQRSFFSPFTPVNKPCNDCMSTFFTYHSQKKKKNYHKNFNDDKDISTQCDFCSVQVVDRLSFRLRDSLNILIFFLFFHHSFVNHNKKNE